MGMVGTTGSRCCARLLAGLPEYLTPSGRAVIYAEGLGNARGPLVLDLLEEASRAGLTIGVTILSTFSAEHALFTIGRMLSAQSPSRIEELGAWHELFARQEATRYHKLVIEALPGTPGVVFRSIATM